MQWSWKRSCHVTSERARQLHAKIQEKLGPVEVLVKSSGSSAPFVIELDALLTSGVLGRIESLFLTAQDRTFAVAINDSPGKTISVTYLKGGPLSVDTRASDASQDPTGNQGGRLRGRPGSS